MRPLDWWSRVDAPAFRRALARWYRTAGRALPWRTTRQPYPIWISEIMLQQTTVAAVIPYYERFLARFPTLEDLANADEAEVLHCWQGLGYYGRALRLHRAAKLLMERHAGRFPRDPKVLAQLPGLGRYTANALASFAWDRRAAVLEANTLRVWTRLCAAPGDPRRAPLQHELWQLAEEALPMRKARDFNHALMDLGALVCRPAAPNCAECPVRRFCTAHRTGQAESLPQLAPRQADEFVEHAAVVLCYQSLVLIHRRPESGLWARLWEFPSAQRQPDESLETAARRALALVTPMPFDLEAPFFELRHSVMHYQVRLVGFWAKARSKPPRCPNLTPNAAGPLWIHADRLAEFPFSTPQRRLTRAVVLALNRSRAAHNRAG